MSKKSINTGNIMLYIIKEKNRVARLKPTLILLDYSKIKTKICTTFCTANQSTKTNIRN
jgi:hypothetical protein